MIAATREDAAVSGSLIATGDAGAGAVSRGLGFSPDGEKSGSCSFDIAFVLPQSIRSVKVVDEPARLVYTIAKMLTSIRSRFVELVEEFQLVVAGRNNLIDSILPPIAFFVLDVNWGIESAMAGAVVLAWVIALIRFSRRQPITFALGGVAAVGIAVGFSIWMGKAEAFFLPTLLSGLGTVLLCVGSVLARRPMVAWTSFLARGWPLQWYWHPQVRPAYSEVTLGWALFFAVRWLYQFDLFAHADLGMLASTNFILGWPSTVILLAVSYLYGLWRLNELKGPSVDEFKRGVPSPWTGQRRGF